MSSPRNSSWRGCASSFAPPLSEQDKAEAKRLNETIHRVNCVERINPLNGITYRVNYFGSDISQYVFRWDTRSYQDIFVNGFRAIPPEGTPDETCYDLINYVNSAGAPLDANRPRSHGFVSTTLSTRWVPEPNWETVPPGEEIQLYRYTIYAPGGIWVAVTLDDRYQYASQSEVCFVNGIAPQYIRSAQAFIIERPASSSRVAHCRRRRVDNILQLNANFNPYQDPNCFPIRLVVHFHVDKNNGTHRFLTERLYPRPNNTGRQKRDVQVSGDALGQCYGEDIADVPSYIDAAFRSSARNEAYLFMKNMYVLVNYAPHSTDDRIVNGPLLIRDGFPSLRDTPFGEYGIDCAFDTDRNEAFIFCTNLCAYIDYAPGTTEDKILTRPKAITNRFPFFEGTVFESGIDAAFKSTKSSNEAYLFREDKYALINYDSMHLIDHIKSISEGFPSLSGTVFANGIDAAFASHVTDEAYLFKGDSYVLINFAPGTTRDYIIDGRVMPLLGNWPSLRTILPRKNGGFILTNDDQPPPDDANAYDHDEL